VPSSRVRLLPTLGRNIYRNHYQAPKRALYPTRVQYYPRERQDGLVRFFGRIVKIFQHYENQNIVKINYDQAADLSPAERIEFARDYCETAETILPTIPENQAIDRKATAAMLRDLKREIQSGKVCPATLETFSYQVEYLQNKYCRTA